MCKKIKSDSILLFGIKQNRFDAINDLFYDFLCYKMDQYFPSHILKQIYGYINWFNLRKMDDIPDIIWKHIINLYCKDIEFLSGFNAYLHKPTSKDKFLSYINHQLNLVQKRPHSLNIPEILWEDIDFMLLVSRYAGRFTGNLLSYKPNNLKNNKRFLLQYLALYPGDLVDLSQTLRSDPDIVLAAVKSHGTSIFFAEKVCKSNRDIAFAAVEQNTKSIKFVDPSLYDDEQWMLRVGKYNKNTLHYATDRIKNKRDFMLAIIKYHPSAIEFASDELKHDPTFILEAAFESNSESVMYYTTLGYRLEFILKVDEILKKRDVWLLD